MIRRKSNNRSQIIRKDHEGKIRDQEYRFEQVVIAQEREVTHYV